MFIPRDDHRPIDFSSMNEFQLSHWLELMRHVFQMPDATRTGLLAFLHLIEEDQEVASDLQVDAAGQMSLKLFTRKRLRPHLRLVSKD
jgi:hypothetical protein